jgi:hypothetical protein
MGEHKLKVAQFRADHPWCCFCGGSVPSQTIDHSPARIIFPNKHRPKGLEFPACERCNSQSKSEEALLAFVCRSAGSSRTNAVRDDDRLRNIIGTINQAYPGILERMNRGAQLLPMNGILRQFGVLDVNQPEVDIGFCRIAAKIALAVFYQENGAAAPSGTRINTTWTHRFNPDAQEAVQTILQLFPDGQSLQAGKWKTDDTFYLRTG